MVTEYIVNILTMLTLLGDLFIIWSLIRIFSKSTFAGFALMISRYHQFLAFAVALASTAGSLFFSEVMKYAPCELCWFQRIFMYPLSVILLVSLLRKDRGIKKYVLPLAAIGSIIAAYHYAIQRLSIQTTCSAVGPSCMTIEMFKLGYITIPMMALTGFIMIMFLLTIYEKR